MIAFVYLMLPLKYGILDITSGSANNQAPCVRKFESGICYIARSGSAPNFTIFRSTSKFYIDSG